MFKKIDKIDITEEERASMLSVDQKKCDFLRWSKRDIPFHFELPATVLSFLENIELNEEEDDVEVIIHSYPLWVMRDWYFIYDQIISSFFTKLPVQWHSLPSLYVNQSNQWRVESIRMDELKKIQDGLNPFLQYLHRGNSTFRIHFPDVCMNEFFEDAIMTYNYYLYQKTN